MKILLVGFITKRKTENAFEYLYKCNLDDFVGNSLIEFKNHMKDHTGDKPVTCTECDFRLELFMINLLEKDILTI